MLVQIINGNILTPSGWVSDGSLLICDQKILEVTNSDLMVIGAKVIDAKGMYIVPGFIDIHAHGGAGFDFKEATEEAYIEASKAHLMKGSTTMFPTLSSASITDIEKAIAICESLAKNEESTICGLHIEGPYLNPRMAKYVKEEHLLEEKEYKRIAESTDCIKRWDISPELHGALDFARYMKKRGIVTAITHTEAEYERVRDAYEAGFTHAAHFYNAMPGFHKRGEFKYEGTVESVYLIDDMTVEIIADGHHLPDTIIRLVHKLKGVERTCLITAALAWTEYKGDKSKIDSRVIIEDGVCKLSDHSALAGSIATMSDLVRNVAKNAKIPLEDAVRMATETPAKLMNIYDKKGSLEKGKDADIVILDNNLNVHNVWSMGKLIVEK